MSIMAKTPSGYKKIGSAYLGERPVDKVFNANGDVVYTLQRELTGVPPLLFKGKEQSDLLNYRIYGDTETKQCDYSGSSPLTVPVHDGELYNYRIYGNTVNGEFVGDRTGNLFDKDSNMNTHGTVGSISTEPLTYAFPGTINEQSGTYFMDVLPGEVYTISMETTGDRLAISGFYHSINPNDYTVSNKVTMDIIITKNITGANVPDTYTFTVPPNVVMVAIYYALTTMPINFQIVKGSTPLPYEPYGYKVPITVTNSGTTSNETIYLPEPIKMVGSEAEYVDFYSQKQYFADGTNTAVTIPALPISAGTNTVTVNTTVQPSNVEVSTDENVSVGDLVTSGQHAGEYEVDVTVEGKNLFDGEWTQGSVGNTGSIGDETQNRIKTIISVTPSQTYTIRTNLSIRMIFAFNDTTDLSGRVSNLLDIANGVKFATITIPNNANLIGVSLMSSDNSNITPNDVEWTMLNEGSTPLPYEPYHAPVTTPIYLPEPIKMVGDEAEYIDYAEQKMHRVRKNLLQNTATSRMVNDVIFTVNDDGSVTCNGTANKDTAYLIKKINLYEANYILTGCPEGGARSTYSMQYTNNVNSAKVDYGEGVFFTPYNSEQYSTIAAIVFIATGYTCENLTFYPMIRKASIEDDTYEPYIENTDLDVTLPALPTLTGTNVLSVGTEVQPSRMDIEGRIKSLT